MLEIPVLHGDGCVVPDPDIFIPQAAALIRPGLQPNNYTLGQYVQAIINVNTIGTLEPLGMVERERSEQVVEQEYIIPGSESGNSLIVMRSMQMIGQYRRFVGIEPLQPGGWFELFVQDSRHSGHPSLLRRGEYTEFRGEVVDLPDDYYALDACEPVQKDQKRFFEAAHGRRVVHIARDIAAVLGAYR